MHLFGNALLALLLAHLCTDFVFQSDGIVREKKQGALRGYLKHGFTQFLSACLIGAVVNPAWISSFLFLGVTSGLTTIHLLLDWAKILLVRKGRILDSTKTFLGDQILHILTLVAASWIIAKPVAAEMVDWISWLRLSEIKILILLNVYVATVFGAGYLVRYLTKPLLTSMEDGEPSKKAEELRNAGMYIGWLERFLVLTAMLLQSPTSVGLILTAKSIARFPELKSAHFAEYFLIGTLLSISMGILGGMILLKVFYGTVLLDK